MDNDKYNPVPVDFDTMRDKLMSSPEGREAYTKATEEFAIIDAMIEAVKQSGLSQSELAQRMGTTQSSISRLLNGGRSPSWKTASRLFHAAGFAVDKIVLKKTPVSV